MSDPSAMPGAATPAWPSMDEWLVAGRDGENVMLAAWNHAQLGRHGFHRVILRAIAFGVITRLGHLLRASVPEFEREHVEQHCIRYFRAAIRRQAMPSDETECPATGVRPS